MEQAESDKLVQALATGFETLQDEYQKLHSQYMGLEKKLATAREQVSYLYLNSACYAYYLCDEQH